MQRPDVIALILGPDGTASRWLVIEIKTTVADETDILRKLQSGADQIREHQLFVIPDRSATLVPLVLHSRKVKDAAVRVLDSGRVQFAGSRCEIERLRCDSAIAL